MSRDETSAEAAAWTEEYRAFLRGRVARVQGAAQTWLGIMTTLLGLFSLLVLLNQGQALGDLPVATSWRVVLYVIAALAFGTAFAAVVLGARATFGGIGAAEGAGDSAAPGPWARAAQWIRTKWSPEPLVMEWDRDWTLYRDRQQELSNHLRTQLHRSRLLGVLAALLVGLLALAVLAIGSFRDDPGAAVVVVERGRVSCGTVSTDDRGRLTVSGRIVESATHVFPVESC